MIIHHRGKCGDLVALCAWLKNCHPDEKARIYVTQHRSFGKPGVDWIRDLLLLQPNVESIGMCTKLSQVEPVEDVLCDLAKARQQVLLHKSYTGWYVDQPLWWSQVGKIRNETDLRYRFPYAYQQDMPQFMMPWLEIPEGERLVKDPYIAVSVTPRYGCMRDYRLLQKLKNDYRLIFAGDFNNWRAFAPWSEYFPVKSSVEAARLLKDADLYVGCQTLQFWLAEGFGTNRILGVSPKFFDSQLRTLKGFRKYVTNQMQLDVALREWQDNKKRSKEQGVVISTYGSPAYVDLQLALHKGMWEHDVAVADDGSHDEKLIEVCRKWEVPLLGVQDSTKGHQKGDLGCFQKGLEHFKDKKWVYKVSRRCLWLKDFTQLSTKYNDSFVLSAPFAPQKERDALCTNSIGLHLQKFPEGCLQDILSMTEVKPYIQIALKRVLKKHLGENPFTLWAEVFLGKENGLTTKDVLWHRQVPVEIYKSLSDRLGLKWKLEDFQDIKKE